MRGSIRRPRFAALGAVFYTSLISVALLLLSAAEIFALEERQTVILKTAKGSIAIQAEIADTPDKQAIGLMFRRHLDKNAGMLFLYDRDQEVRMWMKNTFLPLDMVFIRADGTVHRIEAHTVPFSQAIISSGGPVRAVLELNAGSAERFQLMPGDKVVHPFFAAAR